MVGDKARSEASARIAETIQAAVKDAGAALLAVAALAALALGLAAAALLLAIRGRSGHAG